MNLAMMMIAKLAHAVDPAYPARVGVQPLQPPQHPQLPLGSLHTKVDMMLLNKSCFLSQKNDMLGAGDVPCCFLDFFGVYSSVVACSVHSKLGVTVASQESTVEASSCDFFLAEVDRLWLGESNGIFCR